MIGMMGIESGKCEMMLVSSIEDVLLSLSPRYKRAFTVVDPRVSCRIPYYDFGWNLSKD